MNIDPSLYKLPPGTKLEQIDDKTLALVIYRKSRLIMADGKKILDKLRSVNDISPELRTALKTTAPICSKTSALLKKNGISIIKCN